MHKCFDKGTIVKSSVSSSSDDASVAVTNSLGSLLWRHRLCHHPQIYLFGASHKVKTTRLLGCWLHILFDEGFQLWLLGTLVYLTLLGIETVDKSWGVNWIPRYFTRNMKSFGSSLIYVICDINETGTRDLKISTNWNNTYLLGRSPGPYIVLKRISLTIWYCHRLPSKYCGLHQIPRKPQNFKTERLSYLYSVIITQQRVDTNNKQFNGFGDTP